MEEINMSRKVIENYDLSCKHLFKKKAGNAKYYYELKFDNTLDNDLKEISKLYKENKKYKIFGMHTNLYITENGYNGLFIDLNLKGAKIKFDKEKEEFIVTSNLTNSKLVNYGMSLGYDFSSLTGIPGMVGAGVVGNSSWVPPAKTYGEYVKEIKVFDFEEGKEKIIIPDKEFFSIRNSFLKEANKNKTRFFIKEIVLKAEYIGEEAVKKKYLNQINKRRESLKIGYTEGCAGSIWSNIDLKQKTGKSFREIINENLEFNINFNGARYSLNGGRFFTTDIQTTDKDVAELFKFTINKCKEIYNIEPKKEMIILDYDGEIDIDIFIKRKIIMEQKKE